jgi:hypothetical protein
VEGRERRFGAGGQE